MTTNPSVPTALVSVRGTELLASDTRERYQQKLARITLDSMVQFVGLLDANGTVLEINHVALDAVGIKLSDVEGRPFWTTFWWQVSEEINATLREAIQRAAGGEFVRWDAEIYGRAGGKETIIIDASLMPVRDEQGNVVFITAEGRDITEKKAQEREIARQREELAKLDELKTQFFANISHEFRTPLTLMLGPIEDAMADGDEPLGPRQRERIAMGQRNGLRLQKLVNALLDFSRVEAGRIQAVYQPTDLASLTHDLASSFRAACEKAGLTLTIDTPALPEPIFVDHEMWEKIVLNLVSNAFKFTLEGGIDIELSSADRYAVLRVSDTGTGIPEAEVPRIFERFHRVEGAQGRTYEGTGIGLALVKELIELHKGDVLVESTSGRGTTFIVRMPFGSAHLPPDRLGAQRTQTSTATRADAYVSEALRWLPDGITAETLDEDDEPLPTADVTGERADILLVDDNADMREYLCRLLSATYQVTTAADGEEALAAARRVRPDLIVTDVMMPRLDGFGLLRELRNDRDLRDVPVIVLSARAGDEAKVEGLQSGADDYLVKPFSARELHARVAANIELSRVRSQSARLLQQEAHVLEAKVAERTAELLAANERLHNEAIDRERVEEQLRQAQKMEAIGQLTGGVAHDFNNLLTIVIGNLELIQRNLSQDAPARLRRWIENSMHGSQRAATLTQHLLAFARRQPLDPKPTDLNKLITKTSEILVRTLGERVEVQTVLGAGLWSVEVDPNQLETALLNLAVNARDAMPDGGKLTIETANTYLDDAYVAQTAEVLAGQYVAVCVSDTGTGMPKEILDRVFEPFFTTKPTGQGTGLGLSQVYGFVKQSGGHVKVYSEDGHGTTIKLYLPRLYGKAIAIADDVHHATIPDGDHKETVLLVEDDAGVREYSAEVLRELGYNIIEAENGPEALSQIDRNESVDLLFTDIGLPGMNGRELAEEALRRRPKLKVLYATAYARNAVVHHGRLDAGVQLIAKPFTHVDLATKIRSVMDGTNE